MLNEIEFGRHMLLSPYSHREVKLLFREPFIDVLHAPRKPAAIRLREIDVRMAVQLSVFTVHGDSTPLNYHPCWNRFMCRLTIPQTAKSDLRKHLFALGIRESNLFPDLDHLARQLNKDARTEHGT
jgi:hypothetical protein